MIDYTYRYRACGRSTTPGPLVTNMLCGMRQGHAQSEFALSTIVAAIIGVLTFAFSQYFLRLVIEPIATLRKSIVSVSSFLLYHQREITNGRENLVISSGSCKLAADLWANTLLIPGYDRIARVAALGLSSRSEILEACRNLNLLSYGTSKPENTQAHDNTKILGEISKQLRVQTTYSSEP